MSDPRYVYRLTREQMLETKNPDLTGGRIDYSKDADTDVPFKSFYMDAIRNVTINNKKITSKKQEIVDSDISNFKKWLSTNKEMSKENIERLEKHYSQAPMIFTATFLYNYCMEQQNTFWSSPTTTNNIYEKDGEVYFKIKADSYPISKSDDPEKIIGHIKGPVEAVFKLTDKGFELQHISTNSELLRDMYLGKSVSEERILSDMKPNILVIESLGSTIKNLIINEKKLRDLPENKKTDNQKLEQAAARGALNALSKYKDNKIDLGDLQEAVASYQKQADHAHSRVQTAMRFFSRSTTPPTKKIIGDMLEKINNEAAKLKNTSPTPQK